MNNAKAAIALGQRLWPGEPAYPEKIFHNKMRDLFNWLRHADKPEDPDEREFNLEDEAENIIIRAVENMQQLVGDVPARASEFSDAMTARSAKRGG